jgi:hypothetical protein
MNSPFLRGTRSTHERVRSTTATDIERSARNRCSALSARRVQLAFMTDNETEALA